MEIAVTFRAPAGEPDGRRPDRCERCGSRGFNLHQRATKALKDPSVPSAPVVRYICKRCGKTVRLYPSGVDAARQTVALRRASALLYWLGCSYDGIRAILGYLGCPLSRATVWANARESGLLGDRHRLRADAGSLVSGAHQDGAVAHFRLRGRAVTVRLSRGAPGELILWVGALQPETARLVHRRAQEAARRLGLRVDAVGTYEGVRA
jgi:DNA-directed RNA polymerase subunit RPC12/RpoP